jgi:hypothetical protein
MFKKILITTALITVIGLLVFGAINRTQAKTGTESSAAELGGYGRNRSENTTAEQAAGANYQGKNGNSPDNNPGNGDSGYNGRGGSRGQGAAGYGASELSNLPPSTPGELSAEESAALLYMREEEKLAHDVYVTLSAQWGLPVFQNISLSEQSHADAVKTLIDRYGLQDPASTTVGVFTNPDLQALYNDLIARGGQSLAEALKVGAAIEEIDILDLQKRLTETDNADIQQVFNNLMTASYNHLRAFANTLSTQTGEVYQPQYLSADAYQTILGSSAGSGNGRGSGQGGGQRGGSFRGGKP